MASIVDSTETEQQALENLGAIKSSYETFKEW